MKYLLIGIKIKKKIFRKKKNNKSKKKNNKIMKGGETAEEYKNRLRTLFVSKKIDPKSYSTLYFTKDNTKNIKDYLKKLLWDCY